MTLVELIVTVGVIALVAVVISAAVTVTLRQERDTEGRVSLARWEQSLGTWLPNDLASSFRVDPVTKLPAGDIDSSPGVAPCATADCQFGSNALQLHWNDGGSDTTVGYRYGPSTNGTSFELRRVECIGGSCTSLTILRDLAPPTDDDGNPIVWTAGDPIPGSIITVTEALEVTETDEGGATTAGELSQRVIFTVNGAPDIDGDDRSARVSFTSGGSAFGELDPPSFSGPSFLEARSGCGGPITLIVDESGSIGSADSNVRAGVRSFVRAFEGTPTQLQIVEMYSKSAALGTSDWNRFFDLSEPADVEALIGPAGNNGLVSNIQTRVSPDYWTNWEDALFRTFYAEDGRTYAEVGNPLTPPSELVVFFTDGLPTRDRASTPASTYKSGSASLAPASIPSRFDYESTGGSGSFSPRGWYRADWIRDQHGTRIIGVGVGNAFSGSTTVARAGWPTQAIANEVFLGYLVDDDIGGDPSVYDATPDYIKRTFDPVTGWGDVSTADILVTNDFSQFGSALTSIALDECGGTLTVQSRETATNVPADASISYQVGTQTVTTTRIAKSGTFDVALSGVPSKTVDLVPLSLAGTGYVADSWSCRAGGADLGGAYSLIEAGNPAAGVSVTVSANQAVSCTMRVSPS